MEMTHSQNGMFSFLTRNMSLWHFCWVLFAERIRNRGIKGNYYDLKMDNKFFDIDFKLTIKRVPTFKEKQDLKEVGIDFDRIIEELNGDVE